MVVIRDAVLEDLPQLAELFNLYRVFYRKPSDIASAKNFVSERMNNNESVIYVAEEGTQLLGFTQLYPLFSSTRMKRSWLLNDLYVLEAHRGKGISKQLIERAKQLSRDTNAAGLALETEKINVVGNKLYPSVGFEISDTTNFYWWDNDV
jgi:GNAT superfamily N-acetyltransferase